MDNKKNNHIVYCYICEKRMKITNNTIINNLCLQCKQIVIMFIKKDKDIINRIKEERFNKIVFNNEKSKTDLYNFNNSLIENLNNKDEKDTKNYKQN